MVRHGGYTYPILDHEIHYLETVTKNFMAEDYYKTLGVSRGAATEEIQKSYRKLARKYHPDLHADKDDREKDRAKQQFQQVQQAYDVLSDEKKRQMYDQLGPDFEKMGGGGGNPFGGGGGNPFGKGEIDLSQFFGGGGGGGFEQLFGGRRGQPAAKGQNIEQSITVPFATAVLGGQYQISYDRGNGKYESLTIKVPVGIESGKKIRLKGQGRNGPAGPGDLMVTVNVSGHPNYRRSGLNLSVTAPISIVEAALGAKIELPTPHGTISVTVPPGTSGGKLLKLKNMGIKTPDKSGDLIVQLQIVIPQEISDDDHQLLEQLSYDWESVVQRAELVW